MKFNVLQQSNGQFLIWVNKKKGSWGLSLFCDAIQTDTSSNSVWFIKNGEMIAMTPQNEFDPKEVTFDNN